LQLQIKHLHHPQRSRLELTESMGMFPSKPFQNFTLN